MVDYLVRRIVGILYDVIVKVEIFIFFADFMILHYEVNFKVPIIWGSPFIDIGKFLVGMASNKLNFTLKIKRLSLICFIQ